jgi:hypothetical protein
MFFDGCFQGFRKRETIRVILEVQYSQEIGSKIYFDYFLIIHGKIVSCDVIICCQKNDITK